VESLLVLARTDAVAPDPVPVHLAAVIADRWEAWSPVAADQGARLERACPPDLWVLAVPGALEQILDNLVSNALEVAPDGSAISIGAAVVGDRVEVHVVDQGPGLEADARSQAFERFWRGAGGATADGDGFGLGLAIVAQLATRSGGAARLDAGPAGTGLDAVVTLARADLPTFA
jgi:signal transduction histidine kinase